MQRLVRGTSPCLAHLDRSCCWLKRASQLGHHVLRVRSAGACYGSKKERAVDPKAASFIEQAIENLVDEMVLANPAVFANSPGRGAAAPRSSRLAINLYYAEVAVGKPAG